MQRLATLLVAACALALAFVAIAPGDASAGWRRGWGGYGGYYGPGVGVYVGPGYGYYGYGPITTAATILTPITHIGAAAIGAGDGATSPKPKQKRFQEPFPAAGMAPFASASRFALRQ